MININEKIKDEKLQYNINRETKVSVLSSSKSDKYEYLTSELTQLAKFLYAPVGEVIEKQTKQLKIKGKELRLHKS